MALVEYGQDAQRQALAEINAGHAPTLARFADDYGDLRARLRAACA